MSPKSVLEHHLQVLPHGNAFRFLDGIEVLELDRIVGTYEVAADDPILGAHFPGFPVMPGVLIVEAMAQAAAVLAAFRGDFDPATEMLLLMSVQEAKFRQMVRPPCCLEVHVSPLRPGKIWRGRGIGRVGGTIVAEATFIAVIRGLSDDLIGGPRS